MDIEIFLGSDLLIAFHSTPYGNPLDPHPLPPYPLQLRGFELDVEVLVIDSFSSEVVNGRVDCLFVVSSAMLFLNMNTNMERFFFESWGLNMGI